MAIKPPVLREGDTIGIVTLGSPLEASVINEGIANLKNRGFNVILGNYVYAANGFLSATPEQRASDLMAMFQNPQVNMILPSRGGVGVAGILPYLDFAVIQQNPKIISGYSDITILLNVLYQYANLATFHSLLLLDFTQGTPEYNYQQFFTATATLTSPRQILNPPGMQMISRVPGNVTADIVGGNLTSFVDSLGTPFEIDTKGKILMIEETHEPMNTFYRYIEHLKLAGKFDECVGIILGECTECAESYGKNYEDVINEHLVPLGKPLLSNVATGHGVYKAAISIGVKVNMNTTNPNGTLTVLEPDVSP